MVIKLFLPVSSTDNLCKQFGPRSGLTKGQPDLDLNFLTLMVFLKEFFEKVDFEKDQQMRKMHAKFSSRQRIKPM